MSFRVHCMRSLLQQSFVMYQQRIMPKNYPEWCKAAELCHLCECCDVRFILCLAVLVQPVILVLSYQENVNNESIRQHFKLKQIYTASRCCKKYGEQMLKYKSSSCCEQLPTMKSQVGFSDLEGGSSSAYIYISVWLFAYKT